MSVSRFFLTLATVVVLSVPALSQTEPVEVGGDVYVSDSTVTQPILAERDPIALGVTVALSSDVAEDVHALAVTWWPQVHRSAWMGQWRAMSRPLQ